MILDEYCNALCVDYCIKGFFFKICIRAGTSVTILHITSKHARALQRE